MEQLFRATYGSTDEATSTRHGLHLALLGSGLSRDCADLAAVMASELMSNALVHTDTRRPTVVAHRADTAVHISVDDTGTQLPVLRPLNANQVGGNGIRIVAGYAREWGTVIHDGIGKSVWFTLEV